MNYCAICTIYLLVSSGLHDVFPGVTWPAQCVCWCHVACTMRLLVSRGLHDVSAGVMWSARCVCLCHVTCTICLLVSRGLHDVSAGVTWPARCVCWCHVAMVMGMEWELVEYCTSRSSRCSSRITGRIDWEKSLIIEQNFGDMIPCFHGRTDALIKQIFSR